MRAVLRLLSLTLFTVIFASGAQARSDQEGAYLEYSASAGCPTRAKFEDQVLQRTALAQFTDIRGTGRFFSVYVGVNEGLAVGRVTSGRGDDVGSAREVSSRSCEDVVSAVALIVALAIDPHASMAPKLSATAEFPPESATELDEMTPGVQSPKTADSAVKPHPTAKRAGKTKSENSTTLPLYADDFGEEEADRAKPGAVAFSVGARASGSIWVGSTSVPMAAVAASLEAESLKATGVSPAVRLSAERSVSSTVHPSEGGGAQFTISAARLDACPMRIAIAPAVALRPCVGFEGGRLTGTGSELGPVTQAKTSHRFWGALDESVRAEFQLSREWQVEFEAELMQPTWHDRFVFELPGSAASSGSQVPIITVPVLVPRLTLGLALRFW